MDEWKLLQGQAWSCSAYRLSSSKGAKTSQKNNGKMQESCQAEESVFWRPTWRLAATSMRIGHGRYPSCPCRTVHQWESSRHCQSLSLNSQIPCLLHGEEIPQQHTSSFHTDKKAMSYLLGCHETISLSCNVWEWTKASRHGLLCPFKSNRCHGLSCRE